MDELRTTLKTLDEEIQQKIKNQQKTKDEQKKEIMELLHEYNDIKDATQTVIGTLANIEGVTIKTIHSKYGLPLDS